MAGDIEPQADHLGEAVVGLSLDHKGREAGLGEAGTHISRKLMDDVAVAAIQQHVGDRFTELPTP